MTLEEYTKRIRQFPLPVIADSLLSREQNAVADSLELPDEERRKRFGDRVRKMRQLLGMTQSDVAKALEVTKATVTAYEVGKAEPSLKKLIKLARTLRVSTDWLLGEPEVVDSDYVSGKRVPLIHMEN